MTTITLKYTVLKVYSSQSTNKKLIRYSTKDYGFGKRTFSSYQDVILEIRKNYANISQDSLINSFVWHLN